jgi:membrane protein
MSGVIRQALEPAHALADRVRADQLGVQAGSMTYGAFLAIPPVLILAVSAVSVVLANDPSAQQRLIDRVSSMIPGLEEAVLSQFSVATTAKLGIGIAGILGLLWAGSGFAARTRTALGMVFRTGPPGLLSGRLSGALIGIPSFVGFVMLAAVAGFALGIAAPWWVRLPVCLALFVLGAAMFLLLYWALTPPGPGRPTLREHVPGAVAFTICGVVVERAGGAYVAYVIDHTTALYGTIGAIFGLLAFLYMTMWVFLLGAEISQVRRERASPSS